MLGSALQKHLGGGMPQGMGGMQAGMNPGMLQAMMGGMGGMGALGMTQGMGQQPMAQNMMAPQGGVEEFNPLMAVAQQDPASPLGMGELAGHQYL